MEVTEAAEVAHSAAGAVAKVLSARTVGEIATRAATAISPILDGLRLRDGRDLLHAAAISARALSIVSTAITPILSCCLRLYDGRGLLHRAAVVAAITMAAVEGGGALLLRRRLILPSLSVLLGRAMGPLAAVGTGLG